MYQIFFLIFIMLFSSPQLIASSSQKDEKKTKTIHVLLDKNFRGDENQVLGIQDALKNSAVTFESYSYGDFDLAQSRKQFSSFIFLISGSSGIKFVKDRMKDFGKEDVIIWSGHQVFDDLLQVSDRLSVIFLPKHTASQAAAIQKKTNLVFLNGVPHRIMKTALEASLARYEAKHGPLTSEPSQTVAIILPGDAPDESGKTKFFTPEDAKRLAKNIVKLEGSKKYFLVTNGPRTGSHNYQMGTKLDPSPHSLKTVDAVSLAFIEELKKLGVSHIKFFDFQFSDLPSAYESFLSLAVKGARLHVPGESTSMITEAADVAENIFIDMVPSMNQTHENHANTVYASGRVAILKWDGQIQKNLPSSSASSQTPAEVAADFLTDFLKL